MRKRANFGDVGTDFSVMGTLKRAPLTGYPHCPQRPHQLFEIQTYERGGCVGEDIKSVGTRGTLGTSSNHAGCSVPFVGTRVGTGVDTIQLWGQMHGHSFRVA